MNKKQPKNSVAKKLYRSTNTLSNDKKVLVSNKNISKKSANKNIKKEIIKRETEEAENNEIPTLLKNSEEVSNNGQNIISNKNSDKVEEKLPSVSRKRKRSDAGHIKAAFDDRNHINSKLDPGHRLEIKKRWEIARRKNLSSEERNKSVTNLFELVRGNVPGLLFKNDTSRVLETCLKYGSKEQKSIIASELEGRLLEASKNKYAKYIVCKLMKFCPEYRCKILTEFKGQVKKLFLHTEARIVLLEVYELSNAMQRSSLLEEFYGPEFTLFKRTEILNIKDLIAENPSNKDKILKNLFQAIQYIINKQESFNYIIMHRILLEYFTYADEPKLKKVIEIICEHIPLFLHTREGSQVAMLCFSYGTVKERKVMLKSMKEYIAKICKEEYGYLVLLRAFDVVDDTVSVTKYIIDQMVKPSVFKTIMQDKFGHRMVLYLLTGRARSKMYLGFDTFQLLEKGDEIRAKTSKKDPAIRTNELRKAISPALINYAKENTAEMLSNTYMTQIFCESLLCGEAAIEEKISILENIPSLIGDISNENNIMLTYANRFLKILVQGQFQRLDNGQYKDKQDKRVELHFAPLLFKSIKKDIIFYACNASASFVILALLQDKETGSEVRKILMNNLPEIEQAAAKDIKSGSRFILKNLGRDVKSLIKTSNDKSNVETKLNKRKRENK